MSKSGNGYDESKQRNDHDNISLANTSVPASPARSSSPTIVDEHEAPPSYDDATNYGELDDTAEGMGAHAALAGDGRVNIRIDQQTKGLSSLLIPALRSSLDLTKLPKPPPYVPPTFTGDGKNLPPPLNVVIHVVGSRGDVQPFLALALVLKETYGHRVRLATHPVFKDFVEENGIEFFSIAGDPSELMAFMVKNPGLMPGFESLRRGDVGRRRREIASMIRGCWRSCIEPGNGMDVEPDYARSTGFASIYEDMEDADKPFVADAIIANPPSFAHIHCAEKLGIPLHMMFTMPWSPTQMFPHPLANIQSSNADTSMTNYMSYALVDMLTWQGLGDVINRFRQKVLGLDEISLAWAPGVIARLKVPWTYCWSPALIPKPQDWGPHILCSGFYFLSLANNFVPDTDLTEFLAAGPPPVYIGFGSIVLDDPNAMTKLIFDAVRKSGQRALVSKGWGGFGADQIGIPEGVFMLGNVPHDWLFQHVSCVVHHGGAGTTAAGIAAGKPTVIVPFFGDQPFWGAMVNRAGAGPRPIHNKQLTAENLAEAIKEALTPTMQEKAQAMRDKIQSEDGTKVGAQSFHEQLKLEKMRCQLAPHRAAVWRVRRTEVRLSAFAATVLSEQKLLHFRDLKLYRPREFNTEDDPWDPVTGGASALLGTMTSMAMSVADLPVSALKTLKIHPDAIRSRSRSRAGSEASVSSPTRSRASSLLRPRSPKSRDSPEGRSASNYDGPGSKYLRTDEAERAKSPLTPPASELSRSSSPSAAGAEMAQEVAQRLAKPSTSPASSQQLTNRPRSTSTATKQSTLSKSSFDMDTTVQSGRSGLKFISAGVKSPMDFTMAIAKGFHNAPKLYGDDTVRESTKVTDLASGLKAAGKEFAYGIGDGISGLVTQPIQGAKKEGAAGLVKGFGKGVGGLILKPGAAVWGLPGYTFRGIYMELQKVFGPSVENYLLAARTAQGYEEVRNSSAAERAAVIEGWKELKRFIYKKKSAGEESMDAFQQRMLEKMERIGCTRAGDRLNRPLRRTRTTDTNMTTDSGFRSPDESEVITNPLSRAHTFNRERHSDDPDLEEAIQRSVVETSKGDQEEDAQIEQAIRASVALMQQKQAEGANDEEIQLAMQASIEEANKGLKNPARTSEAAVDADEDDEELKKAIAASLDSHAETAEELERARKEEEIVMQYMLRQSAAEEELRRQKTHEDEIEQAQDSGEGPSSRPGGS